MKKHLRFLAVLPLLALALVLVAANCGGEDVPAAQEESTDVAAEREDLCEPANDVDYNNFNDWCEMSDDPTTILWCTFMPLGHEKITVPIVGKLTDSGKTPFPTKFVVDPAEFGKDPKPAELADPFAMYGVSSEFRYGFDPVGNYIDFTNLPSFCTTEPRVFQSMQSTIVIDTDPVLKEITDRAKAALEAGDNEGAVDILREAESSGGEGS